MAGTAAAAGLLNGEPPVAPRPRGSHPSVREIHKNAWLKRQTSVDKKGTHFSKKGDKFWVVFCVHDDSEAFLEFYAEPKMGTLHKPLSAISLNSCLHVSPSIVAGQDNEYQFAVTLQTEVIRLVAANWDQMIEWVESLQGKLREMNILSPKDNLYSKLPEGPPIPKIIVGSVASTRDPNSPLPPTPSTFNGSLAGNQQQQSSRVLSSSNQNASGGGNARTEQVNRRSADSSATTHHTSVSQNSSTSRAPVNGNAAALSTNCHHRTDRQISRGNRMNVLLDFQNVRMQPSSTSTSSSSAESGASQDSSTSQPPVSKRKQQKISVKVSVDVVSSVGGHSTRQSSHQRQQQNGSSTASATTTVVVIGNGDVRIQNNGDIQRSRVESGGNVDVSTSSAQSSSVVVNGSSEAVAATVVAREPGSHQSQNGPETNCVSRVAVNGVKVAKSKPNASSNAVNATNGDNTNGELLVDIESGVESRVTKSKTVATAASVGKRSCSSENIYEHIYIPESRPIVVERTNHQNGVKCNNGNNHHQAKPRSQRTPEELTPAGAAREAHARRLMKSSNGSGGQRSSSLGRIELLPVTSSSGQTSSSESAQPRLPEHHRDRQEATRAARSNGNRNHSQQHQSTEEALMSRSIGNSTFFANNCTTAAVQHPTSPAPLQGNPLDALIGSRNGEYRLRRDEYLIRASSGETSSSSGSENDNHSGNQHGSSAKNESHMNGGHLPLKEQQVIHLQMEINHPGGVRVILRKKDCMNSIAFVDYLGAVWVAGWKQTQFPVLYYGFHVGDQILKVAGVNVQSSVEASRAIKMVSSLQVEFIIRRLPYGRVFALKRSRDGEPLGLVAEGGSGEISEVLPDGLAARYGLPPKGLSVDGQTPCNWYLTEVNNRPLSLMSKENEVKDRLNAVGKEISILVQPADLVKHLRKSLKSYKGFKDYVVG